MQFLTLVAAAALGWLIAAAVGFVSVLALSARSDRRAREALWRRERARRRLIVLRGRIAPASPTHNN